MQTKDSIELKGIFSLKVYDGENLVEDYTDNNVIVTVGRTQLTKLLGGDITGNRAVSKIGFGENGAAATAADTGLSITAFVKAIPGGNISYPTSTSIMFAWTLENAEGNGLAIQEFGLLCTDNTLFARKQRSTINKTSSIRLVGTWTIQL